MREKNKNLVYQGLDALLRTGLRILPPLRLSEAIALWWGYRYRPRPQLSRLRSGPLIWTTETDHLHLLIYYLGTFEPYCLPYLRGSVPQGGTILDVGANIGFYSLEGATVVGPTGRVIAVEPAPIHVSAIKRNIELNGFQNVSVYETAVGATRGTATLKRAAGHNVGMYSLGAFEAFEEHAVGVRSIDDIVAECELRSLNLIKMDIEGSEFAALVGAEKTLRVHRPALLLELNESALESCGSSVSDVVQLLDRWHYRGWEITPTSARPIDQNYVAKEALAFDRDPARRHRHSLVKSDISQGTSTECVFIASENLALQRKLKLPSSSL